MKKTHISMFLLGVILVSATTFNLYADINFGSRQSALRVSGSEAKLYVSSPDFTVDGTLSQENGGTVVGQTVNFDTGIFESSGIGALIKGTYIPSSSDVIINGNIAYYNTVTRDLRLNSGTLTLDSDLALADNIRLLGPGNLDLNGHQLSLGGYYEDGKPWETEITFENATSIYLTGLTTLSSRGQWTFPGISRINGNGEALDLSAGGKIIIGAGQKLYLEDITVQGLGTGLGSIEFDSASSELHLSNATLVLSGDVAITSGKIIIDGQSTIILKGHKFVFTKTSDLVKGVLIVNGTVLWLEPLDQMVYPNIGYLRFTVGSTNYDIYDGNGYNYLNTDSAVAAGVLQLNNNALIKRTVTQSDYNPSEQALLGGNLMIDISMRRNLTVNADQAINVNGSVTIDGNGSTIIFTEVDTPQLVIAAGKTLTLENITLSKVGLHTIQFGLNSHLNIGENVTFELISDVTFASNTGGSTITPLIKILDLGVAEGANVFTVRGIDVKRVLTFTTPTTKQDGRVISQRPIRLNDNVISFEAIDCKGLDASVLTPGVDTVFESPAVRLLGNSSFGLYGKKSDESNNTLRPYSSIDIFVEGEGNKLNILRDGIDYSGQITFGSKKVNELFMNFNAQNLTKGRKVNGFTIKDGYPYMSLSGVGIGLYSPLVEDSDPVAAEGIARLKIENENAAFEIVDDNAFHVDTAGEFLFKNMQLLNNALKQDSANCIIGGAGSTTEGLNIELTGNRSARKLNRPQLKDRRLHHEREVEKRRAVEVELERALLVEAMAEGNKEATKAVKAVDVDDAVINRTLSLPTTFDGPTKVNMYENRTGAFTGNWAYDGSTITEFLTFKNAGTSSSDYTPFNLVLENNNKVFLADVDMQLYRVANKKSLSQLVNVRGTGNEIHLSRKLTIKSNLFLGQASELTFVFDNDGSATPTVVFDASCKIELEKNAVLRFSGQGKVVLSDGTLIYFRGVKPTKAQVFATNKPSLILTDDAKLDFVSGAKAVFAGYGTVRVTNGAMIAPSVAGNLDIGLPQSYTAALTAEKDPTYSTLATSGFLSFDDFDLYVVNNGEIRLDLPASVATGVARVGLQFAKSRVFFEQGGMLTVGNKGVFNINTDTRPTPDLIRSGALRILSFGYKGSLWVKAGGTFAIGSNIKALQDMTTWNGLAIIKSQELPFMWYAAQATTGGAGTVQYPAAKTTNALSGTFTPTNSSLLSDNTAILARTLMGYMGAK